MRVFVYKNLNDPLLREKWKLFDQREQVHPQSTFEWVYTWSKFYPVGYSLYIITVEDERGILAIAPMRIGRQYGMKTLRSAPYEMSDHYFPMVAKNANRDAVLEMVLSEIEANREWNWVRIDKVYGNDAFFTALRKRNYLARKVSGNIVAEFHALDWDRFLAGTTRNFRRKIKKTINRISKSYKMEFQVIDDRAALEDILDSLFSIHRRRWTDSRVPIRSYEEYDCWKTALLSQISTTAFVLKLDGSIVAYRIGFAFDGMYYDWNAGYLPEYYRQSVGLASLILSAKWLIRHGYKGINFMAGIYPWKLEWAGGTVANEIYSCSSTAGGLRVYLAYTIDHSIIPTIKGLYMYFMQWRICRTVSRYLYELRSNR